MDAPTIFWMTVDNEPTPEREMPDCCRREAQYWNTVNGDFRECSECGGLWRPESTVREYYCGCIQEENYLCKVAEALEGQMHDAMLDLETMAMHSEDFDEERREKVARRERLASEKFHAHFRALSVTGGYEDIPEHIYYAQPPDDGYDEDPRVVGY